MKLPTIEDIATLLGNVRSFLPHRVDAGKIETFEELVAFVESRSAYVGQTSLYGYLKTRMGTRYTELFQDDVFVASINHAKWHVYGACISDLTVFTVHHVSAATGELADEQCNAMANGCFETILSRSFDDDLAVEAGGAARAAFSERLSQLSWSSLSGPQDEFVASPAELVRRAPVTPEFMLEDEEIVVNSILFRWRDVRQQFRKRSVPEEIVTNWQLRTA